MRDLNTYLHREIDEFNAHVAHIERNREFELSRRQILNGSNTNVEGRYQHVYVRPEGQFLTFDALRKILTTVTPHPSIYYVDGKDLPNGDNDSWGCSRGNQIWVRKINKPYCEAITLLHEYAHIVDRHSEDSEGILDFLTGEGILRHEVIAETTCYLVGKYFGLERNGSIEYVGDYLYSIAGPHSAGYLDQHKAHIVELASKIIKRITSQIDLHQKTA